MRTFPSKKRRSAPHGRIQTDLSFFLFFRAARPGSGPARGGLRPNPCARADEVRTQTISLHVQRAQKEPRASFVRRRPRSACVLPSRRRGSRGSRRGARRREAKTQAGGVATRPSFSYPNVTTRLEPKLYEPHVKRHAKPTPTVATLFDGGGAESRSRLPRPQKKKTRVPLTLTCAFGAISDRIYGNSCDGKNARRSFRNVRASPACKVGPSQTGGLEFDAAVAAFFSARPRAAPA